MSPTDHNLKAQLSDIQKRMSETMFNSPKRPSQQKDRDTPEKSASPVAGSAEDKDKSGGKTKGLSLVSRRDKRTSLPPIDGSRALSTQKGSAKDLDFAVGLSENLLQECRRLNAENESKNQKLKTFQEELLKMKSSNANLLAKLNDTMANEERFKDSNWELEMKLQQLTEEYKSISENYQKSQKEMNKHIDLSNSIRSELEEMNLNKSSLEKEYSSTKLTSATEIQDLKSHVDELNDENTKLNDEIDELRRELEEAKKRPSKVQLSGIPSLQPVEDSDSESELQEPSISPVKTVALNNNALEAETLRSSLQSAHHTIAKLRGQILKLRQGELSSKQQAQQSSPPSKKSIPLLKKNIKGFGDFSKGNLQIRGNSNRGSTVIYDDSSDIDDDWEVTGGSSLEPSPSKQSKRPTSVVSDSKELIDDSGSDYDEDIPVAPLSAELQTISEEAAANYAKQNNLVLVPLVEFNSFTDASNLLPFKEQEIISLKGKLSELESKQKEYISSHEVTESKLKAKSVELDTAKKSLDSLNTEHTEKVFTLASLNEKHDNLKSELEASHTELKLKTEANAELETKLANLTEEKAKELETVKRNLNLNEETFKEKLSVSDAVIADLKTKLTDITSKYDELSTVLATTQQKLETVDNEKASLQEQVDNPSNEFLSEKAAKQGLVVISKGTHDEIVAKSNRSIDDLARENNLKVLKTDEYDVLSKKAEEPSIEHLSEHAQKQGHAILHKDELTNLKTKAEKSITEIAKDNNAVVIPDSEYKELLRKLNNPTQEEIKALSESYGLTSITQSEYDNLIRRAEKPSVDEITSRAGSLGLAILSATELESLKTASIKLADETERVKSLNSDISLLKEEASKKDSYIDELTTSLNEKEEYLKKEPVLPKSSLLKQVGALGLVALPVMEHKKLAEPTKEDITKQASKHELTLISNSDFNELKSKASKTVEDLAAEQKKQVLSESDYNNLLNPSVTEIEKHAKSHDLVVVNKNDFELLQEKSKKTLDDLAKESDSVVLSQEKYKKLVSPTIEDLEAHAKSQDNVLISRNALDELSTKSQRTLEDLANESGAIVLSKDAHNELLSPSKDKLLELVTGAGLVALSTNEHEQLKSLTTKPTVEFLSQKAEELNMTLVDKDRFADLSAAANKSIDDYAKDNNLVLLSNEGYEKLLHPSTEKLQSLAEEADLVVVPHDEFSKLKDPEKLDVKDIEKRLGVLGYTAVDEEHLKSLKEPGEDQVIQLCEKYNLHPIAKDAFEQLSSKDHVLERAESLGFVSVPREEYYSLKSRADEPDRATVESQVEKLGCAMVGKKEYEAYLKSSSSISKVELEAKAQKIGHVLVPAAEFQELMELKEPTIPTESPTTPTSKFHQTKEYFENVHKSNEKESSKAKVFESAKSLGFVPVAADEYKHLIEHQKDHVITKSDIYTCSKDFGLTVLPSDEYKNLLKSRQKDDITLAELQRYAKQFDMTLVNLESEGTSSPPETNSIFLGQNHSMSTISSTINESDFTDALSRQPSNASTIHAAGATIGSMTVDELRVQASANGYKLVRLGEEELAEPRSLSNDSSSVYYTGADDNDYDTDHEVESHHDTVTIDEVPAQTKEALTESASKMGLVVLEKPDLESLSNSLDRARLDAGAKDLDLVNENGGEFISAENPEVHKIREIFAAAGLHVLSDEQLQSVEQTAKSSVKPEDVVDQSNVVDVGSSLGMKVIPVTEYEKSLEGAKPTKESIVSSAASFGLVAVDKKEYRDMQLRAESHKHSSGLGIGAGIGLTAGSLAAISAGAAGFAGSSVASSAGNVGAKEAVAAPVNKLPTKELTKAEALKGIQSHGLVALDSSEVDALKQKAILASDSKHMVKTLEASGMSVIASPDLESLKNKANQEPIILTKDDLIDKLQEQGLTVIEPAKLESLKEKANEAKSLTRDDIVEIAQEQGLAIIEPMELESLKNKANQEPVILTKDGLVEKVQEHGLAVIAPSELELLREKANQAPPVLSKDDLVEKAQQQGLTVISHTELESLKEKAKEPVALTRDEIAEKAQEQGLTVIEPMELESLKMRVEEPLVLTKETLVQQAQQQGLAVIEPVELETLKQTAEKKISQDDAVEVVKSHGLVVIAPEELEDLKKDTQASTLSRSQIEEGALALGLVTISKDEFANIKAKEQPVTGQTRDLTSTDSLTQSAIGATSDIIGTTGAATTTAAFATDATDKSNVEKDVAHEKVVSSDDVESWARQHDLLLIPEQSFIATNVSRIPDPQNVVVLPTTYYNKLTKSEVFTLDKITNDELQAQAKKRGFHLVSGDAGIHAGTSTLSRKNSLVSITSGQSRKNMAEHAQAAARDDFDQHTRLSRVTSRNSKTNRSRTSSKGPPPSSLSRDASVDGGLSLMTNASLSEPKIIPALTQTVIGEYVYKYYRRLGPLSSISETRHERYFWVHPYTLTLYWSTTNPVLGNPSNHKTRAAAIISVESVDDNNPLPAGLYHKSIVVHSQSRSVKFTCSTRQRHNIWYNSLRYLIQRSTDGLDFDDDLYIGIPPAV